jgi:putative transcriptional regulator
MKRQNLFKHRKKLGLTQEQAGQAIGLTKKGYNLIENGHRFPSFKVIIRLEKFFGVPASELLAELEESVNGNIGNS